MIEECGFRWFAWSSMFLTMQASKGWVPADDLRRNHIGVGLVIALPPVHRNGSSVIRFSGSYLDCSDNQYFEDIINMIKFGSCGSVIHPLPTFICTEDLYIGVMVLAVKK
jgi:hypothetical protein